MWLFNVIIVFLRFEIFLYWNDMSGFGDIFDVDFFLESVYSWVDVLWELFINLFMW